MQKLPLALLSVCVTFLAWGLYGILLHEGQQLLGRSALRSFVGVGIAYFLVAVLVPAFLLSRQKEKGYWSFFGVLISLFAGTVGALGALGVLLALTFKGSPSYVMPLVFGFAPVVNAVVTMWLGKTFQQMNMVFVLGMVMVAMGSVGVLVTKPSNPHATAKHSVAGDEHKEGAEKKQADEKVDSEKGSSKEEKTETVQASKTNFFAVILSIAMAALCWGAYGPFLHIGQMKMGGSRLRPFFCVGLAYFAIAVAAPLLLLSSYPDQGSWTFFGLLWSIAAGTAGAIGALGIIMAFNFGGKPIFVMPLVFGFAPVVNTLVSMVLHSTMGQTQPLFFVCLIVVALGAATVLVFAPKAKPHGPAPAAAASPAPAKEASPRNVEAAPSSPTQPESAGEPNSTTTSHS